MGWGVSGQAAGDSRSVLLNASYHKKHEHIWLMVNVIGACSHLKQVFKLSEFDEVIVSYTPLFCFT